MLYSGRLWTRSAPSCGIPWPLWPIRATRALENSDEAFAAFAGAGRRPDQILAHMGDLFDWALSMAKGQPAWHNSTPLSWTLERQRFFAALAAFDDYLTSDAPLEAPVERLFQGPVADALTHVGQLALLRRLAGAPCTGRELFRGGDRLRLRETRAARAGQALLKASALRTGRTRGCVPDTRCIHPGSIVPAVSLRRGRGFQCQTG
jgi:hypothetical protein